MLDKDKFAECGGCGNLFDTTNETALALLDTHDCHNCDTFRLEDLPERETIE